MPPALRHVYISSARESAKDKVLAEQLMQHLTDDYNLRVFVDRDADIHNAIAMGVEHAAVILVLSSTDFMEDNLCMKAINYADQRRVPLIHVRIHNDYQPKSWLGALLAPAPTVDTDDGNFDAATLTKLVDTIAARASKGLKPLKMKAGEADLASTMPAPLYSGTQVEGQYFQYDSGFPMTFHSFSLQDNRVMGEGDDEVGSFTISGQYNLKKKTIEFLKQYIGQHSVDYKGTLELHKTHIIFQGLWRIESLSDKFYLKVDLDNRENNGPRRPALGDTVVLLCHATQTALAEKIAKAIEAKGIKAMVPAYNVQKMTSALGKALVVCPLLEPAFQECTTVCKVALSCADANHLPIVPIKAQSGYSQSEWLGVICAGLLYQDFSNAKNFKSSMAQLLREIESHAKEGESAKSAKGVMLLCDTGSASGWYEQFDKKSNMTFSTFVMASGRIIGEGSDVVGAFILHGTYEPDGRNFVFDKQYIGQHNVIYTGTYDVGASVVLQGRWEISSCNYSGNFELQAPVAPGAAGEAEGVPHVMLSYQWGSQDKVKRIAEALTEHGIRVWFDINGDMSGNINVAMAEGVENSKCVLSFATEAYRKSVNCQKELTYANQLKKPIIPVLVEDIDISQEDWLSMIIASVNHVQLNEADFDDSFKQLTERLDALSVAEAKGKVGRRQSRKEKKAEAVIFSGGAVRGRYFQGGSPSEMVFDYFSIDRGRVRGQGDDEVGAFVISGTYSGSKVTFVKDYIGQHSVQYDGKLSVPSPGSFDLVGRWSIGPRLSDRFEMSGRPS